VIRECIALVSDSGPRGVPCESTGWLPCEPDHVASTAVVSEKTLLLTTVRPHATRLGMIATMTHAAATTKTRRHEERHEEEILLFAPSWVHLFSMLKSVFRLSRPPR